MGIGRKSIDSSQLDYSLEERSVEDYIPVRQVSLYHGKENGAENSNGSNGNSSQRALGSITIHAPDEEPKEESFIQSARLESNHVSLGHRL